MYAKGVIADEGTTAERLYVTGGHRYVRISLRHIFLKMAQF